jgi:hypothetical protein
MKHIEKIESDLFELIKEGHEAVINYEEVDEYRAKVKSFLRSSHTSFIQNLIQRVEGERKDTEFEISADMEFGKGRVEDYRFGYNEALDTIIKMLKEEIE